MWQDEHGEPYGSLQELRKTIDTKLQRCPNIEIDLTLVSITITHKDPDISRFSTSLALDLVLCSVY